MACGTAGACGGSGCQNDAAAADTTLPPPATGSTCFKCKEEEAVVDKSTGGLCGGCFESSLYGKFKQAVTTHDLISSTDKVLVAFSGGPSSRVLLQFVHEMQHKAQKNQDASRDKSYPVFGVGVAFIDETTVTSVPSHELDKATQQLDLIVSSLAPPKKELHIVPIQDVLSSDSKEARNKLNDLLHAINDTTGKEDLLHHLRMLCLQKIAFENNYNKLILGTCTSRIASHVISATVKGQGYSLPADIQYIDARWTIPVILPLRDCLAQELDTLCHLNSLKAVDVFDTPRSGINGLVSSFIKVLQAENPARERTIVRTAEKLTPFHFNSLKVTKDSRRNHKKLSLKPNENIASEFFCPICCSPINQLDLESSNIEDCGNSSAIFRMSCCPSCQFQIVPKESESMEHFYSLLPQHMIARAKDVNDGDQTRLREQIQEFLLSDGEDEA